MIPNQLINEILKNLGQPAPSAPSDNEMLIALDDSEINPSPSSSSLVPPPFSSSPMTQEEQQQQQQSYEEEQHICKVCLETKVDCVLIPCGHMGVCSGCMKQVSNCPFCRKWVERIQIVFFDMSF